MLMLKGKSDRIWLVQVKKQKNWNLCENTSLFNKCKEKNLCEEILDILTGNASLSKSLCLQFASMCCDLQGENHMKE